MRELQTRCAPSQCANRKRNTRDRARPLCNRNGTRLSYALRSVPRKPHPDNIIMRIKAKFFRVFSAAHSQTDLRNSRHLNSHYDLAIPDVRSRQQVGPHGSLHRRFAPAGQPRGPRIHEHNTRGHGASAPGQTGASRRPPPPPPTGVGSARRSRAALAQLPA